MNTRERFIMWRRGRTKLPRHRQDIGALIVAGINVKRGRDQAPLSEAARSFISMMAETDDIRSPVANHEQDDVVGKERS